MRQQEGREPDGRRRLDRGASGNAGLSSAGRKQFAAAAVASAKRAADKAGCEYTGKGSLAGLAGSPRNDPAGISRAPGTCAGLRPLAPRAGRLGLSHVWAPRASASVPVEDCVLTTSKDPQLPGYWMSAHFGPYAKDLTKRFAQRVSGERGREKDGSLVWATASCPGAGTRALFLLRGITDNDTRTGTGKVPVKRDSPAFRADALSAFARQSAERHDCGDLKLP
ncbi:MULTISPECIES: hypothetical protein [unclassified Streptomyces]|uniref:hypothetical protein n=1 Tax=unclassified Streptomyces TaxID=2593676 RepID=UPI002DD8F7DD|nr:hypothetical protein [Streptomyces sp. NBC_01795]WSA93070.1 hypothetical protein OIE63_16940 [Streptomyces sp. NBC_01795]WSS43112.1 hypothetical protein OG220_22870 [Streptomyces sp. NBC_01187]